VENAGTVLVIEDNADHAELISWTVRKLGFQAKVATTAGDALSRFGHGKWNAVVMDYSLPDEDGLHLLPRLRQRDAVVPIIMVTAHTDRFIAEKARTLGITGFIVKTAESFYLQVLEKLLAKAIRSNQRVQRQAESDKAAAATRPMVRAPKSE
jgi:DNA-binding response OmpR family regulator